MRTALLRLTTGAFAPSTLVTLPVPAATPAASAPHPPRASDSRATLAGRTYGATKAGMLGFMRTAAIELARTM